MKSYFAGLKQRYSVVQLLLMGMVCVLTAELYYETPYYIDDLWYRRPCGSEGLSWNDFLLTCREAASHLQYDTGRLANLISPLFLCLTPRWLFALLCGVMMWVMADFSCRLCRAERGSASVYVMLFVLVMVLPWYEYMYCVIFSLNYLWATAAALLVLVCLMAMFRGERLSRGRFVALCCLAVVAGWMHEGISVPLMCGLMCYAFVMRRSLTRQIIMVIVWFGVGILLNVSMPAIWVRSTVMPCDLMGISLLKQLKYVAFYNITFCVFVMMLAVVAVVRPLRKKLTRPDIAFFLMVLVAGAATSVLLIRFFIGARISWFSLLLGAVGCLYMAKAMGWHLTAVWGGLLKAVSAVCVILNLGWAVAEQSALSREMKEIVALFRESENGQVYYDAIPYRLTPSVDKTSIRQFQAQFPMKYISDYYAEGRKPCVVLPCDFRGFDKSKIIVPASTSAVRIYGNHIVSDVKPRSGVVTFEVKTDGKWHRMKAECMPFIADNGEAWYLFRPRIATYLTDCIDGKITDVRVIDDGAY